MSGRAPKSAAEGTGMGIRRSFWQVYLHGVVLLVVVGLVLGLTARVLNGAPAWQATAERVAAYVAGHLEPVLDDPPRLDTELRRLRSALGVESAVYRANGQRVASTSSEPPAPAESMPARLELRHERGGIRYLVPLRRSDGGFYLVAQGPTPHGLHGLFLVLAVVLGVVALASLPLARAIARPLEQLTAVVRRFGQGDRAARAGLVRKDEVGALAYAFDDMADRIDRLLRRNRELLANVSHELKTPLARLRVALELCEPEPARADEECNGSPGGTGNDDGAVQLAALQDRLRGMGDDLTELEQLIDDVMVMARLDAAHDDRPTGVVLRLERAPLQLVLDEACARFARHAPERRLVVDTKAAQRLVEADPTLLRRVFDNLLGNAAKYADDASAPIELGAAVDDDHLTVEIRDRGAGVEVDDLPRLFEPFFRADRSRARGTGGSGIGLAFCASVVRAHGGEIDARLREGGGLTVAVRLPLAGEAPQTPPKPG